MKHYTFLTLLFITFRFFCFSQETKEVIINETFSGTRVLNNHSVEMIPKRQLEFIVAHKFGDLAGSEGGIQNFFGFDNLADVRIAFEYGVFDKLDIGVGRDKGVGLVTGVIDGYGKYKILSQKESGMPISLVFTSSLILPYKAATEDATLVTSYPRFINRFTFTNQLLIARKFSNRLSIQANLGYNHRNFVKFEDKNELVFAGVSTRLRLTKVFGILVEYNHVLNLAESAINTHQNPLSIGIELLTGGHSFVLNFSNSQALNENLFIPNTTSNWLDGQFRFGFSINRRFKL